MVNTVFRLLRPEEDWTCIKAENPGAQFTVLDHVRHGTYKTQFISTCKSKPAVRLFVQKNVNIFGKTGRRKVVSIDVIKLTRLVPGCEIIDLTQELDKHILDPENPFLEIPNPTDNAFARGWATGFQEVLIKPPANELNIDGSIKYEAIPIPEECVAVLGYV